MRNSFFILLFIISHVITIKAQNIGAYSDDRGHLYFFNNGQKVKLEYQPVSSFKVGYNNISYVNSRGNLIAYSKDNIKTELGTFANYYQPTDYIYAYQQNSSLGTIENKAKKVLTNNVGKYIVGDSLIAFNDNIKKGFYAYYNNQIIELENNIIEEEILNFETSENTIAYFNATGYFKIFLHGKLIELDRPSTLYNYKVGQNIVAYTDNDNETFNVFDNNKVLTLEETIPVSYSCGDDLVAFVNNQDEFKVYYKGNTQEISSYAPNQYVVIDQLTIYENLGRFSIYYNGKNYELENYWVENFKADNNSLAYIDSQGWLIYFHDGKIDKITNQTITSFSLSGNVLQYSLNTNSFPILYQGKTW